VVFHVIDSVGGTGVYCEKSQNSVTGLAHERNLTRYMLALDVIPMNKKDCVMTGQQKIHFLDIAVMKINMDFGTGTL
jgi:hypothetical protein